MCVRGPILGIGRTTTRGRLSPRENAGPESATGTKVGPDRRSAVADVRRGASNWPSEAVRAAAAPPDADELPPRLVEPGTRCADGLRYAAAAGRRDPEELQLPFVRSAPSGVNVYQEILREVEPKPRRDSTRRLIRMARNIESAGVIRAADPREPCSTGAAAPRRTAPIAIRSGPVAELARIALGPWLTATRTPCAHHGDQRDGQPQSLCLRARMVSLLRLLTGRRTSTSARIVSLQSARAGYNHPCSAWNPVGQAFWPESTVPWHPGVR